MHLCIQFADNQHKLFEQHVVSTRYLQPLRWIMIKALHSLSAGALLLHYAASI